MAQHLNYLKESPSQTAGPYVHIGCTPNFAGITGVYDVDLGSDLFTADVKAPRIIVRGCVFDGQGAPVRDAMIEIWQADAAGVYKSPLDPRNGADPGFAGWGRCASHAETGEFRFETIKPGRVPSPDSRLMAPHITFWIVARGINIGLHTRMYFPDEEIANGEDPLLSRIEHRARVATLIACRAPEGDLPEYVFDIHLQGENETVFLDI